PSEPDEPTEEGLTGDVDNNGVLTENDSAALLHWVLTGEANDDWNIEDIDGDGNTDANDAAKILRKVLNSAYSYTG
ncbi:MAG: hypothetical protein LUH47_07005, partial [Clostridiales bacterium]|nr:hypothetical protein [Clostridiales bacterium]